MKAPQYPALEALVKGLFDYAGMYPPAKLPLDPALSQAARLGKLARPHLVGTEFVANWDLLPQLSHARFRDAGFGDAVVGVAVVGVKDTQMERAIQDVVAWSKRDPRATVGSLEVTSPRPDTMPLQRAVEALGSIRLYIEPEWAASDWAHLDDVLDVLLPLQNRAVAPGLKVRCAGPRAVSPETLAHILGSVRRLGIPLKLTQGLHHPMPTDAYPHGFLTVAFAHAVAARVPHETLMAILSERDAGAFVLDGTSVAWRNLRLTQETIAGIRRSHPLAIGSCSLKEPDDDLVALWGA